MTETGETPGSATPRTLPSPLLRSLQLVTYGVSCPSCTDSNHISGAGCPPSLWGIWGSTSRRAQRPRRPLLGPVPLQNPLRRNLPLPEPPPSDTSLSVLTCGNPTIPYHLPPHPTSNGRAPPLPTPFSLRAATLEEGPSSFGWGHPFGWGHLWCKCHQQLGITRFLGMINFPRLKGRLKFRSGDYATAQY